MNEAVILSVPIPGVAVLQMSDRAGSNTFTKGLVCGLFDTLERIKHDENLHVVVLHGYGSVFCAGGTLEELVDIADGRRAFDEGDFYRLLLDFPLPVISAMQGHAMGGGLVFGLYADLAVWSKESLYGANFMKYGFTPGMGATELLPRKLGTALASEMLYTAKSYHGQTLSDRGLPYPVLPRSEVIPHALDLARELSDKPRIALMELKQCATYDLRKALPEAVQRERDMHAKTFAQTGIRERIQSRYGN